jgi:hypothetical protein
MQVASARDVAEEDRMIEDERYERARKRARELRKFYTHVATYVLVMIGLVFVDYTDRGNWWVYWPAVGWGIVVAMHAFETFSTGWEKRKIRQLMEEDQKDED